MSKPKRHHYLPQFYLEGFCRDGLLWVYDKDKKEIRQQKPINTAVQKYYYSFENEDGQRDAEVEVLLSIVETYTKPIIDKINKRDDIDETEKETLSIFIGFLYSRVPRFETNYNDSKERILRHMNKVIFADEKRTEQILRKYERDTGMKIDVSAKELSEFALDDDRYTIEIHRNESLKMMLNLCKKLPIYFFQLDWLFLFAPRNSSFITTDDPLVLIPPKDLPDNAPYGIATRGAQKFVPLSQEVCLAMFDHGDKINIREGTQEEVQGINLSVTSRSDRFVIGGDEVLVKNVVKTIGFN
jgi:hypothetical protein